MMNNLGWFAMDSPYGVVSFSILICEIIIRWGEIGTYILSREAKSDISTVRIVSNLSPVTNLYEKKDGRDISC